MTPIKTRIRVAADGTLSGRAVSLPPGEHDAEIVVLGAAPAEPAQQDLADLIAGVRAIQAEVAQLLVRDGRSPDEIIGYNARGHFD